jgi:alpha-glucosidase
MSTLFKLGLFFISINAIANPYIFTKENSKQYLKIEILTDDGIHVEIGRDKISDNRIWTTPMVLKSFLKLESASNIHNNSISTPKYTIKVDRDSFCVKIYDKVQAWNFISTCPINTDQYWKGLTLNTTGADNLYGLGQYFTNPGTADGDLSGRVWDPGMHGHGNALRTFSKGANSYAMFPVLYAMGEQNKNFMFFYDNTYKQMWSLNQSPLKVESFGDTLRYFIYTAKNIKSLRSKYMKLTGLAPVPKKDVFGLWISEFGYDSWDELKGEIKSLRKAGFPLDGAALDLQWFGGSFYSGNVDRTGSQFGSLTFDEINFPNPKKTISDFKLKEGISLMPIEESYISKYLPEHKELAKNKYMATWCGTDTPTELTANPWWGVGGMIDWTNTQAGDFWHDTKRQKLIDLGLTHHWTDLGEPEMYHDDSCYTGYPELGKHAHADVHNIYNFKWLESISRGYKRNNVTDRPFIMSRSGTSGVQRFGAGIWSGDIGANMNAMTAHYNSHMHMSFSGVDYYGADIGGFHRSPYTLDGDPNELFTQWFANAALFDFPVRSHTWNTQNDRVTSPSKIGDVISNLANIKLRYKLFPYYYSLAHHAFKTGEPIIIPMAMEFPNDLNVRQMGNQKMIGQFLLGAMVASYGEKERKVYLPKSNWFNFHTGKLIKSTGSYHGPFSAYVDGNFQIPLFIKEGAIIPTMEVDAQTMNISGKRHDGSSSNVFSLIVSPSTEKTEFLYTDDDGVTTDYKTGEVVKFLINQQTVLNTSIISINPKDNFKEFDDTKQLKLTIYNKSLKSASVNGKTTKFVNKKKNIFILDLTPIKLNSKVIIKLKY